MLNKIKRYSAIVWAAAICLPVGDALAQQADDAFGKWRDTENNAHIELFRCGEGLCAKILKAVELKTNVHNPNLKDIHNPDANKKGRLLEGLVIMSNAQKHPRKASWSGKIYSPGKGKNYKGTITVKGKNNVTLKGCIVWPLCSTAKWARLK